jgi:hypothetical protein
VSFAGTSVVPLLARDHVQFKLGLREDQRTWHNVPNV